ncbi:hypothetical protein ACX80S_18995 [Arthrobacter sp. RHLT1-20]
MSHDSFSAQTAKTIDRGKGVSVSPKDGSGPELGASSRWPSEKMLVPVAWGAVWGVLQAVSPLGLWWLPPSTVYAVGLIAIASVYIGFAVADGRRHVLIVEIAVTLAFVVVSCMAITGTPWLLVAGLAAHGLKDLWQHRFQFVANTRWWPPYCAAVDFVAAAILAAAIIAGVDFGRP